MRDKDLFQLALGITSPWFVASSDFNTDNRRLDIRLDFKPGSRFECPDCKAPACPVHDTVEKTWRHLDFFQHQAFLTARTPRINCPKCGVRLVTVPWARPGSGFTLLFEGFAMALAMHLPVAVAAKHFLNITDKRLWRIVFHYVEAAVARMDLADVGRVAIDETAAKRGHDYITLVVDIDERRVVFVADGRSADTVRQFADHLEDHGGDASRIKQASIDMSPAFIKGVTENLTEAEITFDRFHVMKLIGDAVDEVRRAEVKGRPELKGTRYVWTKTAANLTARQSVVLDTLSSTNLKTARAWRMRLAFQGIYAQPTRGWAEMFFDKWIGWAKRSRLVSMKAVARTMQHHRDGILAWFESGISNGLIEGINSLVQAAKAKARGYRNSKTLKAVTYLIAGKLELRLPT
ncbi:MAG: ISL3 family transposase [Hyphomicrobiaceae bacterium]